MIAHKDDLHSSMLAAGAYDQLTQTLYLQFRAKGNSPARYYGYAGVPAAVWEDLLKAKSRGKFFLASIRAAYASVEVPPEHWQQMLDALPRAMTIDWSLVVPVVEFA